MSQGKTMTLAAEKRTRVGSRYARRDREAGRLPAVLYGHGQEPVALTLNAKETIGHISLGEKVFTVKIEGAENATALLRDIQFDYLGSNIIHVDLTRVDLNEMVEVHVRIIFKGDPKGLKTAGSAMLHPTTDLTVRCRVTDIVDHVDLDISELDLGHSLHASDVQLPEGMELLTDPGAVVAAIQVKAEEVAPEAATVAGEAAQPEVLTERKADAKDGKEGGKKA